MELSEFLLARIAEDEAMARAATAGPWTWREISDGWDGKTTALETVAQLPPYADGSISPVETIISGWGYDASGLHVSDEDAAHIARHDPARVLAECEAKRRIVEWVASLGEPGWEMSEDNEAARLLALPYAAHPDYQPEWAPTSTAGSR